MMMAMLTISAILVIKSPQECSDAKFCIHGVVWS